MVETLEQVISAYFGIGIEPKPKRNYVHIGAYEGTFGDSTLYLQQAGWRGVLIETNPLIVPDLIKNRADKKTQIYDVACVGSRDVLSVDFTAYPTLGQHGGLSPHPSKIRAETGGHPVPVEIFTVSAMTVDTILMLAYEDKPIKVDYVQLDVEGTEKDVLKGFDLARWQVQVITIENDDPRNADLDSVMQGRGYRVFEKVGRNTVYERVG